MLNVGRETITSEVSLLTPTVSELDRSSLNYDDILPSIHILFSELLHYLITIQLVSNRGSKGV